MSKLTVIMKEDDVRKVWNYILPKQHKTARYQSLQSIPLLTKQNYSRNRPEKGKTTKPIWA